MHFLKYLNIYTRINITYPVDLYDLVKILILEVFMKHTCNYSRNVMIDPATAAHYASIRKTRILKKNPSQQSIVRRF